MPTGTRTGLGQRTGAAGDDRLVGDVVDEVGHVVDEVDEAVRERPWVQKVTRMGWLAKGAVYVLMGVTAWAIARGTPTGDDQASPQGALDSVHEQPGGRLLLGLLAAGLVFYVCWRILSVVLRRGTDLSAWLDRLGYAFSAVFYSLLAFAAARSALQGARPERDSRVEDMSASALSHPVGRWLLGAAGIITIGVGLYFIVKKGLMKGLLDDVRLGKATEAERRAVVVSGVVGHVGRGLVIVLVGFFVTRAAVQVDPSDAKGFDRALRDVADTGRGAWIVAACAVGLVVYGVFCIVSARHEVLRRS
jgi:Domain of Unknown Function (DUF1206)